MLTAITRAVSPAIARCELSFVERQPINLSKANAQHHSYEQLLEKHGVRVISLRAEADLPDSMFVEDPAIALDELAVILPLGVESRRPEAALLAKAISPFRKLEYVTLPGAIDGGDILRVNRKLFVGLSKRSNAEGIPGWPPSSRRTTMMFSPCASPVASISSPLSLISAATPCLPTAIGSIPPLLPALTGST